MGWTSGYSSTNEIKQMILKGFDKQDARLKLLATKSTNWGRHLWIAAEQTDTKQSFIIFILMRKYGKDDFGYKDMDEDMGPCEIDCPVELLDMTTGTNSETGKQWRERVRGRKAKVQANNAGLEPGMIVLVYGNQFKLIEKRKRSWVGVKLSTGGRYRISPKQIERFDNNAVEYITNVLDKETV